jgi:hypothetical protein
MDKLKIALTLLSIAIVVGPIAGVVLVYKDNLPGLVLPPQIQSLVNGDNSSPSNTDTLPTDILPQFEMPQPVGEPKYNSQTGEFVYPFNFTNPLETKISFDQLSADVSLGNGQTLGTISLDQPINIDPGASEVINATGIMSQDSINQLIAQYGNNNLDNIVLNNVNVTVGGVNVFIPHIDAGSIPGLR